MELRVGGAKDGNVIKFVGNENKNNLENCEPRFFFGLCPASLKTASKSSSEENNMKACAGCLSVYYAGREEQKKDWKRHKNICKVLQPLVKSSGGKNHPLSQHPERNGQIQVLLQASLRRELSQFETDMLVYPRLCMVCLDGNQSKLFNCLECHCASYCCQEHKHLDEEEHAKSCNLLRLCLQDHVNERKFGHPTISFGFRMKSRDLYRPLPATSSDLFANDLRHFWDSLPDQSVKQDGEDEDLFGAELRFLTYRYSCQLSILYGLERSLRDSNLPLGKRKSLTLHVVGARKAEAEDIARWEIFASLLPDLEQLQILLVGPELSWSYPVSDFYHESPEMRRPGLSIRYQFHKSTYHEAAEKLPDPDCVAALNCGFIFYSSWDPTLPWLVRRPGVPLVFTEYYLEDCKLNLDKLDEAVDEEDELLVHLEPSANPFSSQLPARIPTGFAFRKFKRRNVVLSNDFICAVTLK